MQLFDTAMLPPRERADAVSAAMLDATLSTNLVHHDPTDVRLRIESFQLGPVELTHVDTSGMDTTRTRRQTAGDDEPIVALSTGMLRRGGIEQDGEQVRARQSAINLVELTRPYFSRIAHGTNGWSVKIPLGELGVPSDIIRRARPGVTRSPVHPLFAQHLRALTRQASRLEPDGAASLLGTATITLARALICSAAGESHVTDEAMADSLLLRMQGYVRAHLNDPDLTAARIAAAHHVSVRHVYARFALEGLRLEQWIIALRLEGARRDLARPESRHRTIAAIAHRWCFPNASHFTRRFREAYGLTPREWQDICARHA